MHAWFYLCIYLFVYLCCVYTMQCITLLLVSAALLLQHLYKLTYSSTANLQLKFIENYLSGVFQYLELLFSLIHPWLKLHHCCSTFVEVTHHFWSATLLLKCHANLEVPCWPWITMPTLKCCSDLCALHLAPCTLWLALCTFCLAPCALSLMPCALPLVPYALCFIAFHLTRCALHLAPWTFVPWQAYALAGLYLCTLAPLHLCISVPHQPTTNNLYSNIYYSCMSIVYIYIPSNRDLSSNLGTLVTYFAGPYLNWLEHCPQICCLPNLLLKRWDPSNLISFAWLSSTCAFVICSLCSDYF